MIIILLYIILYILYFIYRRDLRIIKNCIFVHFNFQHHNERNVSAYIVQLFCIFSSM